MGLSVQRTPAFASDLCANDISLQGQAYKYTISDVDIKIPRSCVQRNFN